MDTVGWCFNMVQAQIMSTVMKSHSRWSSEGSEVAKEGGKVSSRPKHPEEAEYFVPHLLN